MEETPIQPPEFTPKTEATADPEKIGDLLLRYELPPSEPSAGKSPIAVEQGTKMLVSREKLRAKLNRYREQKLAAPKPETLEKPPIQTADLPEAHFERRKEAIDKPPVEAPMPSQEESMVSTKMTEQAQSAPTSLPPAAATPKVAPSLQTAPPQSTIYKKSLLVGLLAGAITAIALIIYWSTS